MKPMTAVFALLLVVISAPALAAPAGQQAAEENPFEKLQWQNGPTVGKIGNRATIKVPEGYTFLDAPNTRRFMELLENFPSDNEYLFAKKGENWFAVFSFDEVGYVKDNEKLDADSLLETVQKGTEAANEERRKRGWGTMSVLGWQFKPQYDNQLKSLEWAFLAQNDANQEKVINYNTRILGRKGVMEVVLVAGPEELDTAVATLKRSLGGYEFAAGEKYAEFVEGDKVAAYGLAALIAGGAAAVATKKGFWGALAAFFAAAWKMVAAAAVGFFAWLGSLFGKKKKES